MSPLEVQSVHSHPGTEGACINVHSDGYKSNNQLYDECCLSASSWSILSCGTPWGRDGGAVSVKNTAVILHNPQTFKIYFSYTKNHRNFQRNKHIIQIQIGMCNKRINSHLHSACAVSSQNKWSLLLSLALHTCNKKVISHLDGCDLSLCTVSEACQLTGLGLNTIFGRI